MSNEKNNNFFLIFLQGLDKIAHKHDISLLVDEVQTGGGSTGKMWCHEHFDMEHGPGKHLYLLPAIIQLKNLFYGTMITIQPPSPPKPLPPPHFEIE